MRPIRTQTCNLVYKGPTPGIGDLHCERVRAGEIVSFWRPSRDELEAIAAGAVIELSIFGEPIPPVSVNVVQVVEQDDDL